MTRPCSQCANLTAEMLVLTVALQRIRDRYPSTAKEIDDVFTAIAEAKLERDNHDSRPTNRAVRRPDPETVDEVLVQTAEPKTM